MPLLRIAQTAWDALFQLWVLQCQFHSSLFLAFIELRLLRSLGLAVCSGLALLVVVLYTAVVLTGTFVLFSKLLDCSYKLGIPIVKEELMEQLKKHT
jgi:hypothetical protein